MSIDDGQSSERKRPFPDVEFSHEDVEQGLEEGSLTFGPSKSKKSWAKTFQKVTTLDGTDTKWVRCKCTKLFYIKNGSSSASKHAQSCDRINLENLSQDFTTSYSGSVITKPRRKHPIYEHFTDVKVVNPQNNTIVIHERCNYCLVQLAQSSANCVNHIHTSHPDVITTTIVVEETNNCEQVLECLSPSKSSESSYEYAMESNVSNLQPSNSLLPSPSQSKMSLKTILNPIALKNLATLWLTEDQPSFDLQSLAVDACKIEASIKCKSQEGILAGVPFVDAIAKELDVKLDWKFEEGRKVGLLQGNSYICVVSGEASEVLRFERVALNVLSRCSGIATLATDMREKLDKAGWHGFLAGTRKTTPGFRLAEKYSLLIGNASPHRYDLSHMVMLKDNHVKLSGTITSAVERVRKVSDFCSKIEVECRSRNDALEALTCGVDIIMLDNFSPKEVMLLSQELRSKDPHKRTLIEVSGGINQDNIIDFAGPSVDIISTSCIVQGYPTIDFSMKCE